MVWYILFSSCKIQLKNISLLMIPEFQKVWKKSESIRSGSFKVKVTFIDFHLLVSHKMSLTLNLNVSRMICILLYTKMQLSESFLNILVFFTFESKTLTITPFWDKQLMLNKSIFTTGIQKNYSTSSVFTLQSAYAIETISCKYSGTEMILPL